MPHTSATISLTAALAHEALYPRLEALLKQVEVLARRRPESPVVPELMRMAEKLFIEARRFGRPVGRTRQLYQTTTNAGLCARLAQARAGLDAFEAEHAPWDPARKCFCWRLGSEQAGRPVPRLRQQALALPRHDARDLSEMRDKLAIAIDEKIASSYRAGYRDGSGKKPPEIPNL